MRNFLFAAVATLAVLFSGPVSSTSAANGHHRSPSAIMTDLGGLG